MGLLEAKGIRRRTPSDFKEGRKIAGASLEILHPEEGMMSRKSNDNSLVLKISYEETPFLFTGDLEAAGEQAVVARAGPQLKSGVLLVPHHGSKSSCSPAFLEAVSPKVCVISAGKDNPFGFPSQEVLQSLRGAGCSNIRIDEVGAPLKSPSDGKGSRSGASSRVSGSHCKEWKKGLGLVYRSVGFGR
jgi:beta-lactamase superfamily II metal-dependent hydrolase